MTRSSVEKIASRYIKSQGVPDLGWEKPVCDWDEQDRSRAVWKIRARTASRRTLATPWYVWIDDRTGEVLRWGARKGSPTPKS